MDAWRQGPRPVIDDYLWSGDRLGRALLIELLHTELELRLKAGEAVRVEEHLARYPELLGDAAVVGLIAAESRCAAVRNPTSPSANTQAFPRYRAELRERLARATHHCQQDLSWRADGRRRPLPGDRRLRDPGRAGPRRHGGRLHRPARSGSTASSP